MGLRIEPGRGCLPAESDSLAYTALRRGDLLFTVYLSQNKYKFLTNQGNSPNNVLPPLKTQAKPPHFYITPALEMDDESVCPHHTERSMGKALCVTLRPFDGGSGSGALSQRGQTYNELARKLWTFTLCSPNHKVKRKLLLVQTFNARHGNIHRLANNLKKTAQDLLL